MATDDGSVEEFLKGTTDMYHGVTVDTLDNEIQVNDEDPKPVHAVESKLIASLLAWDNQGKRGIWVKVALKHSFWVPILAKHKFIFHHAKEDYVMMIRWLPTHESNHIPSYANHYIGVGGFVVNDKNQVLVVQEKYRWMNHWKLPGGQADQGENIVETAQREVLEETGIQTEFITLLCFRHLHKFRFGCSDIYFICLMKPLTEDIHIDESEIDACQWLDVNEYAVHTNVNDTNRQIARCYLNYKSRVKRSNEIEIVPRTVTTHKNYPNALIYSGYHNKLESSNSTADMQSEL